MSSNPSLSKLPRKRSSITIKDVENNIEKDCDEEDELFTLNERLNMVKSKYMFFPDHLLKVLWDFLIFISIFYQCISLPFRISFSPLLPIWVSQVEIILDILFIFDLLLNFNTGIYLRGMLIMRRKKVVNHYLKTW